mgnify:CR=1 FL=1
MSNVQNLFSQPTFPLPLPGQSFFGSGSIQIFVNSGTFVTPPGVTRIRVRVWGAGGSGGVSCVTANLRLAAGGGGGGHGIKVIDTTPGTSYTVTVGAGGAAVAGSGTVSGNAGGTSSFGTAVTCTGGGAGVANSTSSTAPLTAAGGAGGTSTGGDVNYSGGAGGLCTSTQLQGGGFTRSIASGGGSSGSIFGNGYAGGASTVNASVSANLTCATGGGGVGGAGGAATLTSSADWYSMGGGTFSAAEPSLSSIGAIGLAGSGFILPFKPGIPSQQTCGKIGTAGDFSSFTVVPSERYNLFYTNSNQLYASGTSGYSSGYFVGSYPNGAYSRFPGDILISKAGGGNAVANIMVDGCGFSGSTVATGETTAAKIAGAFGGGGGTADVSNNGVLGAQGSIGGGGGGTAGRNSTDTGTYSGAGGSGMVVVEW